MKPRIPPRTEHLAKSESILREFGGEVVNDRDCANPEELQVGFCPNSGPKFPGCPELERAVPNHIGFFWDQNGNFQGAGTPCWTLPVLLHQNPRTQVTYTSEPGPCSNPMYVIELESMSRCRSHKMPR